MLKKIMNKIQDMFCSVCGGYYTCASDFRLHLTGNFHKKALSNPRNLSKGKLASNDLDKLPWVEFKSKKGWWIRSEEAPYLRDSIRNGHNVIGNFKYYLYAGGACIGRSLNRDSS